MKNKDSDSLETSTMKVGLLQCWRSDYGEPIDDPHLIVLSFLHNSDVSGFLTSFEAGYCGKLSLSTIQK